jgi:hypothetical protein
LVDKYTDFINITVESSIEFAKIKEVEVAVSALEKNEGESLAVKFFDYDYPEELISEESFERIELPQASSSFTRAGTKNHSLALLCRETKKLENPLDEGNNLLSGKERNEAQEEKRLIGLLAEIIYEKKRNFFYLLKECGTRDDLFISLVLFEDNKHQIKAKSFKMDIAMGQKQEGNSLGSGITVSQMYFEVYLEVKKGNLGVFHPKIYVDENLKIIFK